MNDGLQYAGKLTLTLRDENGNIKDERKVDNTITSGGLNWLIKSTMDAELTAMTVFYIGYTTSGGVASIQDGTGTIKECTRQAFTYATGAIGACSATSTFGASGAGGNSTTAVTEAGIFNGTTVTGDGVLFSRAMFAAVNKAAGDSLEVKWDITYS